MTVPRYRENPFIIKSRLLCPGISQNTKHHHLTLYNGQVPKEKPFLEFCNQNFITFMVIPDETMEDEWWWDEIRNTNKLYEIPDIENPGWRTFHQGRPAIAFDIEILESLARLTNITTIANITTAANTDILKSDQQFLISVGPYACNVENIAHNEMCHPPYKHFPFYIWTKEGFKIQINKIK